MTSDIDPSDPTHVSIDLVDGNFYGGDPYPAFAWMRNTPPCTWTRRTVCGGLRVTPT